MENENTSNTITYDVNISHVNIIQNILNQQIPSLLDHISIKENIDRTSLDRCVKRINRLNGMTDPHPDATE